MKCLEIFYVSRVDTESRPHASQEDSYYKLCYYLLTTTNDLLIYWPYKRARKKTVFYAKVLVYGSQMFVTK